MNENKDNELKYGSKILSMDDGRWMTVESIWETKGYGAVDFWAYYKGPDTAIGNHSSAGTPRIISYKRAFTFKDEGIKWKRVLANEAEEELQVKIRLMFDDIIDELPSQTILDKVAGYCRENDEFANGIVMDSDVRENVLSILREGLRALENK